jgi:hypothetical protein
MLPPQKVPFDAMLGLPSREDSEVVTLMRVVERLPRGAADEVARCLVRAALGSERTRNSTYLTRLAEDVLFTVRLRSAPGNDDLPAVS